MNLKEFKNKYIFDTKIVIDKDYILLREPTIFELKDFGEDNKKNIEILTKILPDCLIDWSFTNEDGSKAKKEEVLDVLQSSAILLSEIILNWFNNINTTRIKKKNN